MLRIVALLLVGLVCQAEAALKCVTTNGADAVAADCTDDSGGAITSCFTKVVTDGAGATTTTRGCSANDGSSCVAALPVAPSLEGTACATCTEDGCNKEVLTCFDSTDDAAKTCAIEVTACHTKTLVADKAVVRGCGKCDTGNADWVCKDDCKDNLDYGCNKPQLTCFDSKANAKETCDIEVTACQTKTLVADKAVVRDCGKCDTGNADWVCKDDCTEEMTDGCNEPTRFQCFQSVEDAAEAADCTGVNLYNQTQCYTNTGNGTAVGKGCGACPTPLDDGVTCVNCVGAKCNSATGLFSMLTVCLAIIYQMA